MEAIDAWLLAKERLERGSFVNVLLKTAEITRRDWVAIVRLQTTRCEASGISWYQAERSVSCVKPRQGCGDGEKLERRR
jgi:hypothetical protein